jgi:hypothetical protein
MADHRIELILEQIKALVLAGSTTNAGSKVTRGKNSQHLADDYSATPHFAAVNILQGADRPIGDEAYTNVAFQDCELEALIDLAVQAQAELVAETRLNALRTQVHKVLMVAPFNLGLGYVIAIYPAGADQPEVDADREFVVQKQRTRWRVQFRTSITDPSA